jgi:hypothetical protein
MDVYPFTRFRIQTRARFRRGDSLRGSAGRTRDGIAAGWSRRHWTALAPPRRRVAAERGDALRSRLRQADIVLEPQRPDRLIVGMPDDQHTARHLAHGIADAAQDVARLRIHGGAPRGKEVRHEQRDRGPAPFLLRVQGASRLLAGEQLLEGGPGRAGRCRRGREGLDPDLREGGMHDCRPPADARVKDDERQRQHRHGRRAEHPPRHVADERIAPVLSAHPTHRQRGLRSAAVIANLAVERLLYVRQLRLALFCHPVLATEADGEAEILQLHQLDVPGGIRRHPFQHVEELLATPSLPVQCDQQRLLCPLALRTPRRCEHGFVECGGQRISRPQHHVRFHAGRARTILEPANLVQHLAAQSGDVGQHRRVAELSGHEEQRARGLDEGVEAHSMHVG